MTSEVPPELLVARTRANTLQLEAERKAREAARARQRAKSAQGHYEAMLRRHQGEQALPLVYENSRG